MELKILGCGREVGKTAFLLKSRGAGLLLDCGIKIDEKEPKYPHIGKESIGAAVISHAHLDHIGAVPLLAKKNRPIFMNDVTMELGALLLRDSMKVSKRNGYHTPFNKKDLIRSIHNTKIITYGEKFTAAGFKCSLYDAGHIPGSSGILVTGEKSVFYTGDVQTEDSFLLRRCVLPEKTDTLIIESTYGAKDHPPREQEIEKLYSMIDEAIANESTVLIPTFAVGRTQELLLVLKDYAKHIALDGMSKNATDIVSDYGAYLRDPGEFRKVVNKINFINSKHERDNAVGKHPIIIASAGMLVGGPALHYLKEMRNNDHDKVIFVGYLVEGTPGRKLLDTGCYVGEEGKFNVNCDVAQLDFSSHAGQEGLLSIVKYTNPEKVICVHGDDCKKFASLIEKKLDVTAIAPGNSETIRI